MGNRATDGPTVRGAVKASGGTPFDRDPTISVMGITTKTVLVKGDPVAAKGVVRSLFLHPLTGHGMHPDGLFDLFQHLEATGGRVPTRHTNGDREGSPQRALLKQQQATTAAKHHDVTLGQAAQVRRHAGNGLKQ